MNNETKKIAVQEVLLGVIGFAGLLTVAAFAPNAVQVLKLLKKGNRHYQSPKYLSKIIERLHKKGWIYFEGNRVRLTDKGSLILLRYQMREQVIKQRKWDGKWRVVIFDIKEKKKALRNEIRENIRAFGFMKLQNSVWVYPYPCEELVALLKASCKIGKEVLYMISEKIENDQWLRREFKLKSRKD